MADSRPPVLGFVAYSGTGKTTLLKQLIPQLRAGGVRVGVIKHTHHDFDIDTPGKDSYELRKAGAAEVLVASAQRWALMVETEDRGEPDLQEVLSRLDLQRLDLILVEGFKHEPFPKIELHRPALGKPLIFPNDKAVIALATDDVNGIVTELPVLDLNDLNAITRFVSSWLERPSA